MKLPLFQVDAFTNGVFQGNPAAVVVMEAWLDDRLLQAIAAENNLSETAFVIPDRTMSSLRWFTPAIEIDLCGHATLASAHILWELDKAPAGEPIRFQTLSRELRASPRGDWIELGAPPGAQGL